MPLGYGLLILTLIATVAANVLFTVSRADGRAARDYAFGTAIAAGHLPPEADWPEGARAAIAGKRLAERYNVRMPLLRGLAGVLTGQIAVADAARLAADQVAAEE